MFPIYHHYFSIKQHPNQSWKWWKFIKRNISSVRSRIIPRIKTLIISSKHFMTEKFSYWESIIFQTKNIFQFPCELKRRKKHSQRKKILEDEGHRNSRIQKTFSNDIWWFMTPYSAAFYFWNVSQTYSGQTSPSFFVSVCDTPDKWGKFMP